MMFGIWRLAFLMQDNTFWNSIFGDVADVVCEIDGRVCDVLMF